MFVGGEDGTVRRTDGSRMDRLHLVGGGAVPLCLSAAASGTTLGTQQGQRTGLFFYIPSSLVWNFDGETRDTKLDMETLATRVPATATVIGPGYM